jgi:RNA polymerase sigma factor (sigma-70 family)
MMSLSLTTPESFGTDEVTDHEHDVTERMAALYRKYEPKVRSFFWRRVRDKSYVDDLVQQTFMKVWRYLLSGRSIDANEEPFIITTARHTFVDQWRMYKPASTLAEFDISKDERKELTKGQELDDASKALAQKIRDRLEILDDQYRVPFLMHYVQEIPISEIAFALDISEELVYQRLSRARRKILRSLPKRVRDRQFALLKTP